MQRRPVLLLLPCLFAGCGGDGPGPAAVIVRDSSGIEIVESNRPLLDGDSAWTLDGRARVRIGTVDGDQGSQLYRVADARRLGDGRIVILNGGTSDVRIHDTDGRLIRRFGGEGSGPGEFRGLRRLFLLPGDSMMIVDFGGVSLFDQRGDYLRPIDGAPRGAIGRFGDGSTPIITYGSRATIDATGQGRDTMALVRVIPTSGVQDTLAIMPGAEHFRLRTDAGLSNHDVPFGPVLATAIGDAAIFAGDGLAYSIARYDTAGTLLRMVRRSWTAHDVHPGDAAAAEDRFRQSTTDPNQLRQLERVFLEWRIPDTFPAFDTLLLDDAGNLWVRNYVRPGDDVARWSVFDPGGRWLVDVTMPAALRICQIGETFVIGVETDSLGIEYVALHDLARSSM